MSETGRQTAPEVQPGSGTSPERPSGTQGVTEIKFLIHDLRVESFINEVIHYHVTINTDLEIYSVDQAQAIHGADLQELKAKAVAQRRALQDYTNAVKSFSPDEAILELGRKYIQTIYEICEMILDRRWGRAKKVLAFLPETSRSVRLHPHYMNCIRWICGVYYRIQHFLEEVEGRDLVESFDVAQEVQDFVRTVVYGYVTEKSSARVQIQLDRLDSAVVRGNRYRFRRMFFNLIMNAVDAMSEKRVGVLNISDVKDGDRVVVRVRDNGTGMPREKVDRLLADRESLDGELHSLGFVFVRRTIAQFGGDVTIDSSPDRGTTVIVSLPFVEGGIPSPRKSSECEDLELLRGVDEARLQGRAAYAGRVESSADGREGSCGEQIHADYMISDAQPPGCVFSIGVTADGRIDFFTHRPYERHWSVTHEDLSPMFYQATIRGRLEDDEDRTPVLILKVPQNVLEYFDFREVPEQERTADTHERLVHDELIRIARRLLATGMPSQTAARVTELERFLPEIAGQIEMDRFPLDLLAEQKQTSEKPSMSDRGSPATGPSKP